MRTQDPSKTSEFSRIENPGDDKAFVENYNRMVDELNRIKSNFPLANLNGEIYEASLPNGVETRISHFLRVTPKYWVMIGQSGNAVINDVKSLWTRDYVTFNNNGPDDTIMTFILIRE